MQTAYLHVGAHKTRTSAIQLFMRDQRDWLAERSLYVPRAGQAELCVHNPFARTMSGLKIAAAYDEPVPALAEEVREQVCRPADFIGIHNPFGAQSG